MTQTEFLEKQWLRYEKICKEKGMDAGTKEAFIERQSPKEYKPDQLLEKKEKAQSLIKVEDKIVVEEVIEIAPLFKIKKCEEYILTHEQLCNYLQKAFEAGRESA